MNELPPQQGYSGFGKNYFPSQSDLNSGFKFRVDGKDVVTELLDSLRGGVVRNSDGRIEYNEKYRLMNDLGISRVQYYLRTVVNKNTHLSNFKDEERIMRQQRALAREWCMTMSINRRRWSVADPDLVQQLVEQSILTSMLRADEGFEAEISGKSHSVVENVNTDNAVNRQQTGFFRNMFGFGGR